MNTLSIYGKSKRIYSANTPVFRTKVRNENFWKIVQKTLNKSFIVLENSKKIKLTEKVIRAIMLVNQMKMKAEFEFT